MDAGGIAAEFLGLSARAPSRIPMSVATKTANNTAGPAFTMRRFIISSPLYFTFWIRMDFAPRSGLLRMAIRKRAFHRYHHGQVTQSSTTGRLCCQALTTLKDLER